MPTKAFANEFRKVIDVTPVGTFNTLGTMLLALRTNEQTELLNVAPSFRPCDTCKRSNGTCQWAYMSCFAEREPGDDAPILRGDYRGMMDIEEESPAAK